MMICTSNVLLQKRSEFHELFKSVLLEAGFHGFHDFSNFFVPNLLMSDTDQEMRIVLNLHFSSQCSTPYNRSLSIA